MTQSMNDFADSFSGCYRTQAVKMYGNLKAVLPLILIVGEEIYGLLQFTAKTVLLNTQLCRYILYNWVRRSAGYVYIFNYLIF